MSASGEAAVGWSTTEYAYAQVTTMSPEGTWSAPETVSKTSEVAGRPDLGFDAAGDLTAAWDESAVIFRDIRAASRPAGGEWGEPKLVSAQLAGATDPELAVDPAGAAALVWIEESKFVEGASRAPGGAWRQPVELSEVGEVREPRVAIDEAGEAVAVWLSFNGHYNVTQSAAMGADGGWGEGVDISEGTEGSAVPDVSIDSGGEAVAIWEHSDVGVAEVKGTTRAAGAGWSKPVALTRSEGVGNPDLSMSAGGFAVLVWQQSNQPMEYAKPYFSTRPKGGAWNAATSIAPGVGLGFEPIVATDGEGDAIAAWEGGEAEGIAVAGFDGAGPKLSGVSIPASGAAGAPLAFSLKATDVWSPIASVNWSFGDGASAAGASAAGAGVSHAFAKGGAYPVTATATDAVGNATTTTGTVAVAAGPTSPTSARGVAKAKRAAIVRGGRAELVLACGADPCAGVATLSMPAPKKRGSGHARPADPASADVRVDRKARGHARRPIAIGKAAFALAPAAKETVKVKLSRVALARLAAAPAHRLAVTLGGTGVAGGKVTLVAAKPKQLRR